MERHFRTYRIGRIGKSLLIVTAAGLALAGCAQSGLLPQVGNPFKIAAPATTGAITPQKADPRAELIKATTYWGQQFMKNPKDPQIALNYARNLRALGQKKRALAVLERSRQWAPNNRELTAELGRLAVDTGQLKIAKKLLAEAGNEADWKTISAKGALEAQQGNYKAAQALFNKALAIKPGQPSIINNLAMAYALDGQAGRAEELLRQLVKAGKSNKKIRQNLALVLGLQGKFDQAREISARDLPVHLASANEAYLRRMLNLPKGSRHGQAARAVSTSKSKIMAAIQASSWQTDVTPAPSQMASHTSSAGQPILLEPPGE